MDTAVSIYDQVVSLLRVELRVGLVLGLLVALVAFLAGGTTAARQLRASSSRAAAWVRTAGDRRGISTGPVGVWLDQQRVLVRVVVISLAALALVLADRLTPAYVVGVFVVALLVLGLATLAARPRGAESTGGGAGRPGVTPTHPAYRHAASVCGFSCVSTWAARSRPRFQSANPSCGGRAGRGRAGRHRSAGSPSIWANAGTASADSPAR